MFAAAAVLMMGVACQQEELPQGVGRGEALVSFKVEVPGDAVTKAIADGKNVNILYYEVYDADMKNRLAHGSKTRTAEKVFDLQLTLVQDQTYNFLFWAQVDGEDYYTVTDLRNVTVDYTDAVGNDEARAAFFAAEKFAVGKNTLTKDIFLKRPFAQLNFGTTTFKSSLDADVVVNSSVITVTKASTKFDVFAGVGSDTAADLAEVVFTAKGCPTDPTKLTVNPETAQKQKFEYLSMNYFFVGGEESTVGVNAVFNTTVGDVTHSIPSVPVAENFRTNIVGDLLFNTTNFKIYVDEKFITPDNDVYFAKDAATLVSLVENANDGDEIKLMNDVELSEILVINKDITIDGDGNTLTTSAGRAINVDGEVVAAIKNLDIVCSGERAINIINGAADVTVENVTATCGNYAIMIATSAENVNLSVSNSDLTGLNVVNVAGPNANVKLNNTKLTCDDKNEKENYGAISFYATAVNSKVYVRECEIVVNGDSFAGVEAAYGASIVLDEKTTANAAIVKCPFAVIYPASQNSYVFETFAEALEVAKDGETITLTQDVNQTCVIDGKKVTVDLNGHTLTGGLFAESNGEMNEGATDSYGFWVKNGGELTVTGNGAVKTQACNYSIAVWAQGGKVTIQNGAFENFGEGSDLIYASANGHVVINGGEFKACEKQTGVEGTENKYSVLNLRDNTGSSILVNAGKFYKFNPADNLSENPKVNFVAEGKTVEQDGDWFIVK